MAVIKLFHNALTQEPNIFCADIFNMHEQRVNYGKPKYLQDEHDFCYIKLISYRSIYDYDYCNSLITHCFKIPENAYKMICNYILDETSWRKYALSFAIVGDHVD
jgi:hypothetical protein